MAVKFLSEDWATSLNGLLAEHEAFQSAIGSTQLGVQFEVTDGTESNPVNYYLNIEDGVAFLALGKLDAPEVTISSDYETASGISKGDLNTQTAFMTGKIMVTGNLAVLMMHQNVVTQWGNAGDALDIEY
jgi:putative sterol carrier protein